MKAYLLILTLLLLGVSCERLEGGLDAPPRGNRTTPGTVGSNRNDSTDTAGGEVPPDTCLWVSAVSVPEGYNWLKDTAMGAVEARLLLYKDSALVFSAPIGARHHLSAYPDSHHLTGGHIYSEYISGNRTSILRDAEPLFEFEGSEYLKGLTVTGGDIYTLGSKAADKEFVFRKNGEAAMRLSGGRISGGIGEASPALYEIDGKAVFAFIEGGGVSLVQDGVMKRMRLPGNVREVFDVRIIGGEMCAVYSDGAYICLYRKGFPDILCLARNAGDDFLLVDFGGMPAVLGSPDKYADRSLLTLPQRNLPYNMGGRGLYLYDLGGKAAALYRNPLTVSLLSSGNAGKEIGSETLADGFVFTKECTCLLGGHLFAGVSSLKGESPYLTRDLSKIREYPIEGYITGVCAEIIPPNAEDGSRQASP